MIKILMFIPYFPQTWFYKYKDSESFLTLLSSKIIYWLVFYFICTSRFYQLLCNLKINNVLFAIGEIINSPEQSMVIILEGIIHMGQNCKCLKGDTYLLMLNDTREKYKWFKCRDLKSYQTFLSFLTEEI